MAVTLRLRRIGKKKQPFYRIVAINSRAARGGRYIENIGTYNPLTNPAKIELKEDRALYWLKQGAIPSDTVRSFLRRKGILLKWHLIKRGVDEAGIEEELKKWEVLQLERQKRREALAEQKKREVIEKSAVEAEPEAELKEEGVKASTERDLEAVEVTEESKKKVSEKEEEKQIKASNKKDTETVKAKTDEKKRKVKEKRTAKVETKAELEEEGVKATPDKDLEAVEVTEESKEKVSKKNEQKQTGPRKRKTRNN